MPQKTSGKPITIKLGRQLGQALRKYKLDTNHPITDIVRRALICYWLTQNTAAASFAINTAEFDPSEPVAACPTDAEFDEALALWNEGGHDETLPGIQGALAALANRVKVTR